MSGAGVHPPLVLVAAVARNRVIGSHNQLPWRLRSDLRHFRSLTLGKPLIMGRKTWESIGAPLPGRETVVVTRDRGFQAPGAFVAFDLPAAERAAAAIAHRLGVKEIVIAGGADIYAQTIGRAVRLHITEVDCSPEGDALFPEIVPADWQEIARTAQQRGDDDTNFAFVEYAKSNQAC